MLNLQTRLTPNDSEVAAKIMDGEAIMLNLSTGIYYSMDKIGSIVWELIEKRYTLEEIINMVAELCDVSSVQVHADLERLAAELVQENLVSISEDGISIATYQKLESSREIPYESPKLSIYRDMGDLLALDPPMPKIDDVPWTKSTEQ